MANEKGNIMIKLIRATMGTAFVMLMLSGPALAVGAIAVDDDVGLSADQVGFGFVIGADDKKEAERGALRECRKQGNDSCKVAVWFEQCGAYAASREHSGIGYGRSKEVARRQALDECGTEHCRIVVAECEE
jgi:hypothetical protein